MLDAAAPWQSELLGRGDEERKRLGLNQAGGPRARQRQGSWGSWGQSRGVRWKLRRLWRRWCLNSRHRWSINSYRWGVRLLLLLVSQDAMLICWLCRFVSVTGVSSHWQQFPALTENILDQIVMIKKDARYKLSSIYSVDFCWHYRDQICKVSHMWLHLKLALFLFHF